jgi:hypothetical protein
MTNITKTAIAATATAVATAAAIVASAGGQAPSGTTLVLHEVAKDADFAIVDNPPKTKFSREGEPRRFSIGDMEVVSIPVADDQGHKVGRFDAYCVLVRPGKPSHHEEECTGTYRLADGTISGSGVFVGSEATSTFRGAITGGTGAYEGARGTITDVPGAKGTTDTLHLLP